MIHKIKLTPIRIINEFPPRVNRKMINNQQLKIKLQNYKNKTKSQFKMSNYNNCNSTNSNNNSNNYNYNKLRALSYFKKNNLSKIISDIINKYHHPL